MHLEPHSFVYLYLVLILCLRHFAHVSVFVMITKHDLFCERIVICPQFCGYQTEVNILLLYFIYILLMYLVGLVSRYTSIYSVLWISD